MVMKITVAHDDAPLTFKASFCLIDIPAHRFFLGRDLLVPLQFEASAHGLKLTDPKSGVSTLFPYESAPVNMCSVSPFLGATFSDLVASPGLKGDFEPI